MRGNCGGAFKKVLPYLDEDEHGYFVPAYRVAPNCSGEYADLKIRSCPVASANKVAPITQAYFRHINGLFDLKNVSENLNFKCFVGYSRSNSLIKEKNILNESLVDKLIYERRKEADNE